MEKNDKQRDILITVAGTVLAAIIFLLIRDATGDYAAIMSAIPIALIGYFFGTRPGLLAATVAFPFNTFLLDLVFRDDVTGLSLVSSIISLSLVAVAWLFGRFHRLRIRLAVQQRDHQRAQTALAISEERMRGFLNASPDIIFRVGQSGRLLEVHGEQRFGLDLTRDQYLFRPLDEILPNEAAAAILMGSAEARSKGSALSMFEIDLPEGRRSFQVSLSPGGGSDVVGIARDVTTYLETEEQRRMMDMIRAKDDFVAGVAHELRTPLAGVLGLSQTLRDSPDTLQPGETQELLDLIAAQSRRISYRIDDLIVAARADGGQLVVEVDPVDLADSVASVVKDLGADVKVDIAHRRVLADRHRLDHILRNLIGNAVEHGGAKVAVSTEVQGELVLTRITDNGPGVGASSTDVFAAYNSPTDPEAPPDRIGVGLTVAKQLAGLMRGDVQYRRDDNLTVFELSLPAA